MKKILAISLVAFLASCGGSNDDIDTTSSGLSNGTVAEGSTSPGATTAAESSVFLTSAYQDGAAEIALSELALDKATNEGVRTFAQRMIDVAKAADDVWIGTRSEAVSYILAQSKVAPRTAARG